MLSKGMCWLCVFFALSVDSANAKTNLLQAFQSAYDNDPQFHEKEFISLSQQQQTRIDRSSLLPQLSAETSSTLTYGDANNQQNSAIGLSLNQSIIDAPTWLGYQGAKISAKASQVEYAAALQDLIKRTVETYLDALSTQNKLRMNKKAADDNAQLLKWTEARFQAGLVKAVDVDSAQAAYQQRLAELINAKKELREKLARLQTITGIEEENLASLKAAIPINKPSPLNLPDWTNSLRENNLVVRAGQYQLQAKRENIKAQHAGHYPKLDATAGINRSATTNNAVANGGTDTQVTLNLSLPLYSGGKTSAQTQQATYDYQTQLERYRQNYRAQLEQLQDSYQGVLLDVDALYADRQVVAAYQQALHSTQIAYESGLSGTNIEGLITAQQSLNLSQQQLFSDKCDYLLNVIKLKQAAGLLSVQDVVQMNSWLQNNNASAQHL